jgi:hypothetical protein
MSWTIIKTNIIVDYVGGTFEKNYQNNNVQPLSMDTNFGLAPSFVVKKRLDSKCRSIDFLQYGQSKQ